MTYGGGQLARGIGGGMENLQGASLKTLPGQSGFGSYFSSPMQSSGGIGGFLDKRVPSKYPTDIHPGTNIAEVATQGGSEIADQTLTSKLMKKIDDYAVPILLGSMGLAAATAKPQDVQEAMKASRGTGMDIDSIREEVRVAFESGPEAWNELKKKYPYIGGHETKKAAEGGIMRAGYYAGGQSVPSDYTMEDAMMTTTQDKLGGITDVMKQADLYRQGSVGQMYAAEGGLMDLGGMEKDYRNDGGFVPIGGKEKADDVPARLSKNEFVFTADAVRGAGGGDIDKGAEIMENMMKSLESGGEVSEESQGLEGARGMFANAQQLQKRIV